MTSETFVRVVPQAEFQGLNQKLQVNPDAYTKPVRFYIDVDGVILPQHTAFHKVDVSRYEKATVRYLKTVMGADVELHEDFVYYDPAVMNKISEWSQHPNIEVVWLTSWRISAPFTFDEQFNIHSAGYLPWDNKFSDYDQVFKGVAIEDEQLEHPSSFVWIDDLANRAFYSRNPEIPYFTRGEDKYSDEGVLLGFEVEEEAIPAGRYITVSPETHVGLTVEHINRIETWLTGHGFLDSF